MADRTQYNLRVQESLINDIAICIVVAWVLALVAQVLKQPLVLAYLIGGYLAGPMGFQWIHSSESIVTIAEIGLILLLFMIGLEIDLKKILSTGRLITVTAIVQILGCGILGWILFRGLGGYVNGTALEAVYLAVAVALSSTVIIVKMLYDQRELDTLPGRITLGVLVLQDLFAILFLALQPSLTNPAFGPLLWSLGKVTCLMATAFVASRYILPPLFHAVARLPELVQVGALAWCFLVAGLASTLGLSREMGALIAGVSISTFPYTLDVTAKVSSLRDFFLTLFFVGLGMAIPAPSLALLSGALVIAGLVIFSRMATVFPTLYLLEQGHRTSLLTSVFLSQISEFSLVILTLGLKSQHLSSDLNGMVGYAFVILAVVSTYATLKSEPLIRRLQRALARLGLPDLEQQAPHEVSAPRTPKYFLLGFFNQASSLLEHIERYEPQWLPRLAVIDFNPQVYARLRERRIRVIYGDVSHRETLIHSGVGQAEIIVNTLPDIILKGVDNLRLLHQLREINPHAQIIVQTDVLAQVPALYAAGASYVLVPRLVEAADMFTAMQAATDHLLPEKRAQLDGALAGRREIIG